MKPHPFAIKQNNSKKKKMRTLRRSRVPQFLKIQNNIYSAYIPRYVISLVYTQLAYHRACIIKIRCIVDPFPFFKRFFFRPQIKLQFNKMGKGETKLKAKNVIIAKDWTQDENDGRHRLCKKQKGSRKKKHGQGR